GANEDDNGGTNRGALHIMLMNSNGTVKSTVEINDSTANGPALHNNDEFGISVADIGDLDGDGIQDIAAGAVFDDNGGTNRGALHIMFMNVTYTTAGQ
ncbi:MAG: FG-GAP repeat protein, partial [Nitrosopumilaceae archaeon]|nr:FG-GAP repeat protein [Nitrosopumilaceae archaeon]